MPITDQQADGTSRANEIQEVDVEAGFIIGSTCCSLEIEEDDDLEGAEEQESAPAPADPPAGRVSPTSAGSKAK